MQGGRCGMNTNHWASSTCEFRNYKKEHLNVVFQNRGALVDIYGPGTVFHHIRKRRQVKAQKEQKRQKVINKQECHTPESHRVLE